MLEVNNLTIVNHLRNLQEQVKKAFCYQKLFWPFTIWINCFSDLKNFGQIFDQIWLTKNSKGIG